MNLNDEQLKILDRVLGRSMLLSAYVETHYSFKEIIDEDSFKFFKKMRDQIITDIHNILGDEGRKRIDSMYRKCAKEACE